MSGLHPRSRRRKSGWFVLSVLDLRVHQKPISQGYERGDLLGSAFPFRDVSLCPFRRSKTTAEHIRGDLAPQPMPGPLNEAHGPEIVVEPGRRAVRDIAQVDRGVVRPDRTRLVLIAIERCREVLVERDRGQPDQIGWLSVSLQEVESPRRRCRGTRLAHGEVPQPLLKEILPDPDRGTASLPYRIQFPAYLTLFGNTV